jgi:hypothetical protein
MFIREDTFAQRDAIAEELESMESWTRVCIVASLSWPVSYLTVASLTAVIDLSKPSMPILWLIGLVMGGVTAISGGIIVRRQLSSSRKWVLANVLGIPFSLTVAYLMSPFAMSPIAFAAVGLCSGLLTSTAQSLALQRGHSKVYPLLSGTVTWALAFLLGYMLLVQKSKGTIVFMPGAFFSALLLGWGVTGLVLLILLLGLSPLSHDRALPNPGIKFN